MPSALTPTPSIDNAPSSAASLTPIPVVGVGASAGGLDAFTRLIHHLPSNTGMAYVLVQHLDPEHESLLPELLGRAGAIPVVQAVDGVRIEADRAYVIAPNTTMTVTDGAVTGVAGHLLEPSSVARGKASSRETVGEFELEGQAVIVTGG